MIFWIGFSIEVPLLSNIRSSYVNRQHNIVYLDTLARIPQESQSIQFVHLLCNGISTAAAILAASFSQFRQQNMGADHMDGSLSYTIEHCEYILVIND